MKRSFSHTRSDFDQDFFKILRDHTITSTLSWGREGRGDERERHGMGSDLLSDSALVVGEHERRLEGVGEGRPLLLVVHALEQPDFE